MTANTRRYGLPARARSIACAVICAAIMARTAACSQPTADQYIERGEAYFEQGQYQAAIIEFRNAIQIDPQLADVRLKLGEAYLNVSDGSAALREYVRAADLRPDDHDTQVKAGNLLLLAGSFEDARSRADKVLEADARHVDAQILRGNALAGLKDLDGAIAEYEEAVALDPSRNQAFMNLGTIQFAKGRREEAEAAFESAVEAAPDSIPARLAVIFQ